MNWWSRWELNPRPPRCERGVAARKHQSHMQTTGLPLSLISISWQMRARTSVLNIVPQAMACRIYSASETNRKTEKRFVELDWAVDSYTLKAAARLFIRTAPRGTLEHHSRYSMCPRHQRRL